MNKRIISLSAGLAMLINMASVLPASVFAKSIDTDHTEEFEYNGSRYMLFDTPLYWKDAQAYCESLGGHLAVITDDEEKKAIEEFAASKGTKQIYWLGGTDEEEEGNWKWVTGEDPSLFSKYGTFDNMGGAENYLALTNPSSWYWNDWGNSGNDGSPIGMYAYENLGFICEWDEEKVVIQKDRAMDYTVFSGNTDKTLQLYSYKNQISGNVYCGSFFSSSSILDIKGRLDSTGKNYVYGWKSSIDEKNDGAESVAMPDWDNRITKAAGAYEYTEDSVFKIEDSNVIDGSLVSGGSVEISGTSFSGDCYIIANGDITYNINEFKSPGRIVLYSKNGNIKINGNDIDFNGIMYAPNGKISFSTNITNINGRLFADSFDFSGSQLNVVSSDSDWELLGRNNIVTKTYTTDEDFSEGTLNDLTLDISDELTLNKTEDFNGENIREYDVKLGDETVSVKETVSKQYVTSKENNVNVKFDFLTDGNSRYELINEGTSWTQAKANCEMLGGHLVTISDEDEWNTVRQIFENECGDKYHLWMGGYYDASDREWKWIDGTSFDFTNWDAGEPNREYSSGKYEDYLMCYNVENPYNSSSIAYKWNDIYDTGLSSGIFTPSNYCYICEWDDKSAANSVNFSTTVKNIDSIDTEKITPLPEAITKNSDGSSTISWKNVSETVCIPFRSADTNGNKSVLLYNSTVSSASSEKKISQTDISVRAYTQNGSWKDTYQPDGINGIELTAGTSKKTVNKPSDNVDLEFTLNGFGIEQVEENNVDLAIVIDTSGSMSSARMTNAKNAANEVINHLKPGDRCEIVGFSSSASIYQSFTNDKDLLKAAVAKFKASGGTNIEKGIRKAVEGFTGSDDSSRQKYIILLSDGEDSSKSSDAAYEAYNDNGITIFALSVGNYSSQMETVAEKANGRYLVSSTPEEIDGLMQQFAAEVFDVSGKQAVFEIDLPDSVEADNAEIVPAPDETVINPDGSTTLRWKYDTVCINDNKNITVPVTVNNTDKGIVTAANNISCTYLSRDGNTVSVKADDIVLSVNEYASEGTWETVYDSGCADTVWSEIFWNGMQYDDSKITVQTSVSDDNISYSEWYDVNNHEKLDDIKGQYIRLKVTEVMSSTGKTPELFDISVYSEGADCGGYINMPPSASISGPESTFINRNMILQASSYDDAFGNGLEFTWSCESDAAIFSDADKPYTAVKFSTPGEYTVELKVSDGSSETLISKNIVVFDAVSVITPEIVINVPEFVKGGAEVAGKIINVNSQEISKYSVQIDNNEIKCDKDGNFTFTAPSEDAEVIITAKATASNGLTAKSSAAVTVDAEKPDVHLYSDPVNTAEPGEKITLTLFANDANGILTKVLRINGEEFIPDSAQFELIAEENKKYVIEFYAEDIVGNSSSDTVEITVAAKEPVKDPDEEFGPNVYFNIPKVLSCGQTGNFNFTCDPSAKTLLVSLNGKPVSLDETGSFTYTPEETGEIILDIYADDEEGKKTEFQLSVKVVSINIAGKEQYADNETVELSVTCSDNVSVTEENVLIDDRMYSVNSDGKVIAEGLSIGAHKAVLYVTDSDGITYIGELYFSVVDVTVPDVKITLAKTDLKEGDTAEAFVKFSDNVGVDEIKVLVDGKEYALSDKNSVIIENISAGNHIIEVLVSDAAGNRNSDVCEFNAAGTQAVSQISVEAAASYDSNKLITVKANVSGTNEAYKLYGTVNGTEIEFIDDTAVFQASAGSDYNITVVAEDSFGKSVSSLKLSIPEEKPEFSFKITAEADKTNVTAGEKVSFTVKSNSLKSVSVKCKADGGTTEYKDGIFAFVSSVPGVYTVEFTGTDSDGNTASDTVVITVNEDNDYYEDISEYKSPFTPETQARVLVKSSEPIETKLTEEMKELADGLGSPLAVYEYLYNTINTEFYMGSRKGAIGAYEQKGANDVDSASLLIAMLRYLGCKADYVTGEVGITGGQLMKLTCSDSVEKAVEIFTLQLNGITYKFKDNTYYFNHTWVRTEIDGVQYDLDSSFKEYKHVDGIAEIAENSKCDIDFSKYTSSDSLNIIGDTKDYFDSFEDEDGSEINVTGKNISCKKFIKFPAALPYICNSDNEIINNIKNSRIIKTDYISFSASSSKHKLSGPEAYISSVKLVYAPYDYETDSVKDPESIYSSNEFIYLSLFVNGNEVYTWEREMLLGQTQNIEITEYSSGFTFTETKKLIAGSVNSVVIDQQNISPQSIKTVLDSNVLTDSESEALDNNKLLAYNDEYIGDYLELIGTMYFTEQDYSDKIIAGAMRMFSARSMSYGVFSYNPCITSKNIAGVQISSSPELRGRFLVDIIGNYKHYTGYSSDNVNGDRYLLASGYMSSYYESYILETMTGIESVSTAAVFDLCGRNDIDIHVICSENIAEVDKLGLSTADKNAVKAEAKAGKTVLVPEKNVTVNDWTGSAYIVLDSGKEVRFMISGDANGGASTMDAALDMLCVSISTIVDFVETVKLLMVAVDMFLVTGNIIGGVVVLGIVIAFMAMILDFYFDSLDLYIDVALGRENAEESAAELQGNAKMSVLFTVAGMAAGPAAKKAGSVVKAVGEQAAKNRLIREIATVLKKPLTQVTDVVGNIVKKGNSVARRSKIYKKIISKQVSSELAAEVTIKAYSDDILEKIVESDNPGLAAKYLKDAPEEYIEYLNKTKNPEFAIKFVTENGDDAIKASVKYGDDALDIVYGSNISSANQKTAVKLINKYDDDSVVKIIKDYGDDGVLAIDKHGDNAVNIIKNYGDDGVLAINKHGDNAVNIIQKYGDDGVVALEKYNINPDNIYQLEKQGITPEVYNKNTDYSHGFRNIDSDKKAEKYISMYKKIESNFDADDINNIRSVALRFEELLKGSYVENGILVDKTLTSKVAKVTNKQLGPAVAVAYYKDESKGIYKYYIAINSVPEGSAKEIAIDQLDLNPELLNKVYEIEEKISAEAIKASTYVDSYAAGSHAEVKAVNKAMNDIEDFDPDKLMVYVNYTDKKVSSDVACKAFTTCPHCEYILSNQLILSDCMIECNPRPVNDIIDSFSLNVKGNVIDKNIMNQKLENELFNKIQISDLDSSSTINNAITINLLQ